MRSTGTALPGVIKDGTYLMNDGMMFFEMHNTEKCVTVTLDDEKYKKIIFEVEDKESTALEINEAVRSRR